MDDRVTPKTIKTVRCLLEFISQSIEAKQARLPSVKSLASKLGVSQTTVCKALRVVHEQGLVTMAPRTGIRIVAPVTVSHLISQTETEGAMEPRQPRWQQVATAINADVLSGIFPPGSQIPSCKEMAQRYRVCFVTLKRAIARLVGEGRLEPCRRGYRVFQCAPRYAKPLLLVVSTWPEQSGGMIADPRIAEFWRSLERECHRLAMDVEMFSFAEVLGTNADVADRHREFRSRQKNRTIVGYFVRIQDADPDQLARLCSLLAETGKRVSVLDEGRVGVPAIVTRNRRFRLFAVLIGPLSGKMVGEYLIGMGHRRIACFSSFANLFWSRNRIDGLVRAFSATGIADAVVDFSIDDYAAWNAIQTRESTSRPFAEIQRHLTRAQKVIRPALDQSDKSLYDRSMNWLWRCRIDRVMPPVFEKALLDKRITAWVATNDQLALSCLSYLLKIGRRVPAEISVVGFDDILESLDARLTSYNFNFTAVAVAMVDHVLAGRFTQRKSPRDPIEIPGIMMERASSGPARKITAA